jgi:hypothetical protein
MITVSTKLFSIFETSYICVEIEKLFEIIRINVQRSSTFVYSYNQRNIHEWLRINEPRFQQ